MKFSIVGFPQPSHWVRFNFVGLCVLGADACSYQRTRVGKAPRLTRSFVVDEPVVSFTAQSCAWVSASIASGLICFELGYACIRVSGWVCELWQAYTCSLSGCRSGLPHVCLAMSHRRQLSLARCMMCICVHVLELKLCTEGLSFGSRARNEFPRG